MAKRRAATATKPRPPQALTPVVDTGPAGPSVPEPVVRPPLVHELDGGIPADFQVDNVEGDDDDDIVHELDEPPTEEFGMPPEEVTLTTTQSLMAQPEPTIVNEVADHGVQLVGGERTYKVRVVIDVGPVFYGDDLIELKKGRLYAVPEHIHRYLREKDLLWEQQ